jgi:hypothetical protein
MVARKLIWIMWVWISSYYLVHSLSFPNLYANFRNFRHGHVGGIAIAGSVAAFVQFKSNKDDNKGKTVMVNMNSEEDETAVPNFLSNEGASNQMETLSPARSEFMDGENEVTVAETVEVIDNGTVNTAKEPDQSHQGPGIPNEDMQYTKSEVLSYLSTKHEDILKQGWSLVHLYPQFSLYKRHKQPRPHLSSHQDTSSVSNHTTSTSPLASTPSTTAMEYLMIGEYINISPYSFFLAQMNYHYRKLWDNSMRDMSIGKINILKYPFPTDLQQPQRNYVDECTSREVLSEEHQAIENQIITHEERMEIHGLTNATGQLSTIQDMLYYRTKIPWPLKDRDYSLSRR